MNKCFRLLTEKMPRGFGRGAKTVGIVTHAQAKTKGKKTPRGLRGVRQKKRARFQQNKNEDRLLEKSLGLGSEPPKGSGSKSLTEDIASIYVPHVINKRQKGLKTLRKQILGSVKEIYRARANSKKKNSK